MEAGHPFTLNLTNRLLMLLIYYHLYTPSTLLSYLFGTSQTGVLKNIRRIKPSSAKSCPYQTKNTKKSKK
ncbi:MAG: transposase family protein [Nitrososphaerota archaeon]|nr:transposase family protein [Nitrososphaerota archaeon]